MRIRALLSNVTVILVLAPGLSIAADNGSSPGANTPPPRLPSGVNINSIDTAPGTSQLKPGFNCPPGKSWNTDVAFPACVGTPVISGRRACNSAPVSWTGPTGARCTATAPVRNDGQTAPLVAGGAYAGSATALCDNGYWTTTGASTCTPPDCPASTLQWQVGSAYCQSAVASATNGISRTLASTNANPGSASFMCNNGTWGAPYGVTCAAPYTPPPVAGPSGSGLNPLPVAPAPGPSSCNYPAVSGSWGVGCSGSASAGSLALNGTVAVNNSAAGYSGAITYRCETPGGGGSPSLREISRTCNPGPTCSYAVLGLTTGATVAWQNGAGSASCSGPLPPPPAPGSSVTVNSTNGNTGTYRATCLPSGSWDPNAVVTCDLPPTTQCNPRAVSWTGADGTQCSGSTSATPYGQTVTVYSSNGNTGATDITCNAGTGTWSAPFNGNCAKPAEPCPGGGVTAWGNCLGAMPDTPKVNGEQWTATNQQYGYTGAANLTCDNGVWKQNSATCDMDAAPPSCSTGYKGVTNFAYCTKKQAWASEIQRCTVQGSCMADNIPPPPGYGPENTYVEKGYVWVACPGDPKPWTPFPPESQAAVDLENLHTRQTYCAD